MLVIVLALTVIPWQRGATVYAGSYEDALVVNYDLSSSAGLSGSTNVSFVKSAEMDATVAQFKGTGNNTSYLKLPNTAFSSVSAATGLTISLWFNADAKAGEWSRLFDFGYSEFGQNMPFMFLTPDMHFSYNSTNGAWMGGTEKVCDFTGNTVPERGTWNHVVVTLSATEIHLYLNGNLIGEAENDNGLILNNLKQFNSVDLGRSKFQADPDYIGYMKDVSIYKTALTAEDVVNLYQSNGGTGAISTPSPWEAHDMKADDNSDASIQFPSAPTAYTNDYNKRQNVHDPSLLKGDDGYYYMYSTGLIPNNKDVEIRRSQDMIEWEYVGVAKLIPANSEVSSYLSSNIWAPEVIKYGNEYRMYYSCSGVSGGNSCIALATSDSPKGPFTHKGIVVTSTTDSWTKGGVNAIDANIISDTEQNMYMVWGSFFGGIKIAPMDAATGYLKSKTDGTIIAKRSLAFDNGACEGPFVFYNADTGYYYLVVSYGNLTNEDRGGGGYSMRVGRSKTITGPYLDYNGKDMTDTSTEDAKVGYKLATNYKFKDGSGWMCIGGNSVYQEDGKFYCVAHARVNGDSNAIYVNIRQMFWTEDGWPLCNPSLYAGETEQKVPVQYVPGKYERIEFAYTKETSAVTSKTMQLYPNYTASVNNTSGTWTYSGENMITVTLGEVTEKYKIVPSWDWEKNQATYTIMGINTENGLQRWGKKVAYYDWTGEQQPTEEPTKKPDAPTAEPTKEPDAPTAEPTKKPDAPTEGPTKEPDAPTEGPTKEPDAPTEEPTKEPDAPTAEPTKEPDAPTEGPTKEPDAPTEGPTKKPDAPTEGPTKDPSPTGNPSVIKGTVSLAKASQSITKANTDKGDPKGSVFATLRLKGKGSKKAVKLSWTKVKGANGYIIYGSACGRKMKEIAKVSASQKNYTVKKLKRGKYYKYVVAAYKEIGGEIRVSTQSKSVHVCTSGGKVANPVKVSAKKSLTVKKGKTKKLSAKMKPKKKIKVHIAKFRYESSNTKIATVNKKGKLKAKKKGRCIVYIYAQNGLYAKTKIKVK